MKNKKNIKLLDVGCGNGRLAQFLSDNSAINYYGVDNNRKLLGIAKEKNPSSNFKYGDALKLPFPSGHFDSVWAIALLHHLPGLNFQLKALKEMKRVLKKNGLLAITVWNLHQKKYAKYIDEKNSCAFIPWGQEKKIKRYYYVFTPVTLLELLKKAGFRLFKKIPSKHNIVFVCQAEPQRGY